MVVELLRPRDEALAVGGREKEAAMLVVGEELDRESCEPVRLMEPAPLPARDVRERRAEVMCCGARSPGSSLSAGTGRPPGALI